MYCDQCGSSIDYRFPTTCLNCNHELTVTRNDSDRLRQSDDKNKARLKFRHHLVNLTTTVAAACAGLISGAVVTYLAGACVYLIVYRNEASNSHSCGRGTAVAFLLLLVGANLGSAIGGIFGFENRIFKTVDGRSRNSQKFT